MTQNPEHYPGNPARVIKTRFDAKIIDRLLEVKWWDWDDERIANTVPLLLNEKIPAFLSAVDPRETRL